jgi:outer membrane protein assembly factor BamB
VSASSAIIRPVLVSIALAVAALGSAACRPDGVGEPRSTTATTAVDGGRTESRMFRGVPSHTGSVETRGVGTLGRVAWRFETRGPVRSTPALAGGVLYFGSSDGHLYAVRATDGEPLWTFEASAPVASSPAVTDRAVIFADRANVFYALDRRDGGLLWSRETGPDRPLSWGREGWDYLSASPVLLSDGNLAAGDLADGDLADGELGDGGLALIGSGDGTLYALDAESGEERWRFETERRIRSTPAVADGVAYFGGGDGVFYALDVGSGETRWTFETTGVGLNSADFGFDRTQIQGSAAIADGTVYFGSRDGSLYALDAATGELRWHREDGTAWVVGTPALHEGTLFNGRSSGGRFRAIDAGNGEESWVITTRGLVFSSPTVVGDVVYVGSGGGAMYALDTATGTTHWSFATVGDIYSSPVVADGRLYFGSDDGSLYALEVGEGPSPRLGVFWDDSLTDRAFWGGQASHRAATDYFERHGYESLDAAGLVAFFEERLLDGIPSVVVFGMDALPSSVAATPSDTTLLRRYLDAGGKVVWLGLPPLVIARDETGAFAGVDRERPGGLLGVDLSAFDFDVYGATPTEAGRSWGLREWRVASPAADTAAVDVVLALDELNRAAAWVREYGGPRGTGFVYIPASTESRDLDDIRRVAEAGLIRPLDAPRP